MNLSTLITYLNVNNKSYYAAVLNGCRRVADTSCDTIAVGVINNQLILYYNPTWISDTDLRLGSLAVEHEALHLILDHLPRRVGYLSKYTGEAKQQAITRFNIAADCAVNSLLNLTAQDLKAFPWVLPTQYNLPSHQTLEFYLDRLKDYQFKEVSNNHSKWLTDNSNEDLTRSNVKELLKNATKIVSAKNIPEPLKEWLSSYTGNPTVPWQEVLTNIIRASLCQYSRNISTLNRGLLCIAEEDVNIIPNIGRVLDPRFKLFFLEDTSASMQESHLLLIRNELQSLIQLDEYLQIRHLQGDSCIQEDTLYCGHDTIPMYFKGRGGTNFNEWFKYVHRYMGTEDQPDLVIIATDGDDNLLSQEYRLPEEVEVLWLIHNTSGVGEFCIERIREGGYGKVIVC